MTRRIRVLEVITAYSDDAPAQSAAVLAKYLDLTAFEVIAVSLRTPPNRSSTVRILEQAGIPHFSMRMGGFLDLAAVVRLYRFMWRRRPDVVHSHAFRADLWCGLAAKLARVPLIVSTVRSHDQDVLRMEHPFPMGTLAAAASRFATGLSDCVVAVSDGVRAYLEQAHVPADKIRLIHNGFDFERLANDGAGRAAVRAAQGWSEDDIVIGTLAVLKERKGLRYLPEAAKLVLASHPSARFFVAGEGPGRAALEAAVEGLGIQDRFHLLGQRSDPLALLGAADIYVLPSLFEGLPRSLLEAMAMRKAVVVTDIGGSREVVRDGVSGFVVPPRDVVSLAGAISRLAGSQALRIACGDAGERTIRQQFDARRTAAAHETIYRRDREPDSL